MLNNDSNGPLSGYAQYVDYTISRSFILTHSGLMGLSPSATKEGDIVVEVRSNGRIVWLTLREDPRKATPETQASQESKMPRKDDCQQELQQRTYQLVGEAYIHNAASRPMSSEGLQWFTLS